MKTVVAGVTWDVCERGSQPPSSPRISIHTKGKRIFISGAAFEAAKKPEFVRVLYSETEQSVALMPVRGDDPSASVVSPRAGRTTGWNVAAAALCRRLITGGYTGTLYLPVQWHPEGILWGDLAGAKRVARSKAKGGAA